LRAYCLLVSVMSRAVPNVENGAFAVTAGHEIVRAGEGGERARHRREACRCRNVHAVLILP